MDNTILRNGKIYTLTADKHEKVILNRMTTSQILLSQGW